MFDTFHAADTWLVDCPLAPRYGGADNKKPNLMIRLFGAQFNRVTV
jgi:hypothetical protein